MEVLKVHSGKNCGSIVALKRKDGRFHPAVGLSKDFADGKITPDFAAALMPFIVAKWKYVEWKTGEIFLCSPEIFPDRQSAGEFAHEFMANLPEWEMHPVH